MPKEAKHEKEILAKRDTKICTKCRKSKPMSDFIGLYARRLKGGGWTREKQLCAACREEARVRRVATQTARAAKPSRVCRLCEVEKKREEFLNDKALLCLKCNALRKTKGTGKEFFDALPQRVCHECGEKKEAWAYRMKHARANGKDESKGWMRTLARRCWECRKSTGMPVNAKYVQEAREEGYRKYRQDLSERQALPQEPVPPPLPTRPEPAAEDVRTCQSCGARKKIAEFISQETGYVRTSCAACREETEGKVDPVQRELHRRALLRKSLINFVAAMSTAPGGYNIGWVHQLICAKLEEFERKVLAKESPRLIITVPPRHGKSEIASKLFPAWYLGRNPEHEVIAASYAVALPLDFSKRVKDLINTEHYQGVFPLAKLKRDSRAAEVWNLTRGGGYVAAGVSGPITGKGAHCLIIDDPVKDAEEADSETIRKKTWAWFGSTALSRLAPGGGVLVIQTRWHDEDLTGKLLYQEKEARREIDRLYEEAQTVEERAACAELYDTLEGWDSVDLPALAESDEYWDQREGKLVYERPKDDRPYLHLRSRGDALHPARYNRKELLRRKATMQPRHWSALYQGRPTPEEGDIFKKEMVRYYEEEQRPKIGEIVVQAAWDLAIGKKDENDFTVGLVGGMDHRGDVYLLDMIRGRLSQYDAAEAIALTSVKYGASLTGIENGQLEKAMRPTLDGYLQEKKLIVPLAEGSEALVPITDKIVRSRPAQGMAQQGRILFPKDQPWTEVLVGEMLNFPNGLFDDTVDALSWLIRMFAKVQPPAPPKETFYKKQPESWKDRLRGIKGRKNFMAA